MEADHAIQQSAWRRLLKNRGAVFGLFIISLTIIVALSAYFIDPDGSPSANRMIVEIEGKPPGFTQTFLQLPKEKNISIPGFFSRLIYGREDAYNFIPVTSYRVSGDTVYIDKYVDEGITETIASPKNALAADIPANFVTQRFPLGTDKYGRDILSRLLLGSRISLSVGLIAVVISLTLGILLGAVAGYFGGWPDDAIMWLINVIWSIPTLLLVFAITLVLGKGFWQVFAAVGLTMWVSVARIVRGQVLSVKELEYVEAARALGYSNARTIFRHILPNIMGPVLVIAASNFASAIVIEAGLSFLGVGVQPPQPSWGLMIKENYNFIITHNPVLALAPGFAIMLLVLAFNLLGNGLRDAMNVRE